MTFVRDVNARARTGADAVVNKRRAIRRCLKLSTYRDLLCYRDPPLCVASHPASLVQMRRIRLRGDILCAYVWDNDRDKLSFHTLESHLPRDVN